MGAAELGRELGDAGGPLLVAGVAAAATLTAGFGALAALIFLVGASAAPGRTPHPSIRTSISSQRKMNKK
ncbi:MAG: hypothetical protein ACI9JD_001364 [Rhodococcus sp. (in: high G+C Gram-positive bacteria)]|jgi:hypothetical protein